MVRLLMLIIFSLMACSPQQKSEKTSDSQKSETVVKAESCPPTPKCEAVSEKKEESTSKMTPQEEEEQRENAHNNYNDDRNSYEQLKECQQSNQEYAQDSQWKREAILGLDEAYTQLAEENTALKSQIQALEVQLRTR